MVKYYDPGFKVNVNGSTLAADISGQIRDVKVTHEINTVDSFSFTLVNQYPKMRWTHTSDRDLFRIGGTVSIEMGYVNDMQKIVDGEILTVKPSFPDSGGPTLGIDGQNLGNRLQRSTVSFSFKDKTDTEILNKLIEKTGLKVDAEDTGAGQISREVNGTAWDFLMKRAAEINFEVFVDGKTLIFRKAKPESKAYSLEYGQTLRSFTASLDLKSQVSKVVLRGGHDFATDKDIVGHAGPGDEDGSGSGKTAAKLAADWLGSQAEAEVTETVKSQEEADARAKAIYNQKLRQACKGTAGSIGLPALRAGKVVELTGIGPLFSGLYKITKSIHTLNASGYLTELSVERWRF